MEKSDYKNIWVFIEIRNGNEESVSLELCCEGRRLADSCGEKLVAVIIGDDTKRVQEVVALCGVDEIIFVEGSEYAVYTTDPFVNALAALCDKHKPSAIMIGATNNGRDLAPRLAARLKTGSTADASEISYNIETKDIDWTKPSFGGNLMATIVCSKTRPQIGTVRPGTFKKSLTTIRDGLKVTEEKIRIDEKDIRTKVVSFVRDKDEENVKIEEAEVVICLGAGLNSMDQIDAFKELAELLGGTIGVTRPLVFRDYYSVDVQVGQSGKSISPKLYLGFGISGAVQHTSGITSSETIIAVNNNPEATLFGFADYAVVGDMFEIADALVNEIKAYKGL